MESGNCAWRRKGLAPRTPFLSQRRPCCQVLHNAMCTSSAETGLPAPQGEPVGRRALTSAGGLCEQTPGWHIGCSLHREGARQSSSTQRMGTLLPSPATRGAKSSWPGGHTVNLIFPSRFIVMDLGTWLMRRIPRARPVSVPGMKRPAGRWTVS